GVAEELHQFFQFGFFFVTTSNIIECHFVFVVYTAHFGFALAEGGHFAAASLHSAHEHHKEHNHDDHHDQRRQDCRKHIAGCIGCHNLDVAALCRHLAHFFHEHIHAGHVHCHFGTVIQHSCSSAIVRYFFAL